MWPFRAAEELYVHSQLYGYLMTHLAFNRNDQVIYHLHLIVENIPSVFEILLDLLHLEQPTPPFSPVVTCPRPPSLWRPRVRKRFSGARRG